MRDGGGGPGRFVPSRITHHASRITCSRPLTHHVTHHAPRRIPAVPPPKCGSKGGARREGRDGRFKRGGTGGPETIAGTGPQQRAALVALRGPPGAGGAAGGGGPRPARRARARRRPVGPGPPHGPAPARGG